MDFATVGGTAILVGFTTMKHTELSASSFFLMALNLAVLKSWMLNSTITTMG